jgi:hypothetical protein
MTTLQLNVEQAEALRVVLDRILSDMSVEIADTDLKVYRDDLKHRRDAIREVKEMLAA